MVEGVQVRRLATAELTPAEIGRIRGLLYDAFAPGVGDDSGGFSGEDWAHASGGTHVVLDVDGTIVAHAAVVPRDLRIGHRAVRAGYVEAVATDPGWQGWGLGSIVMEAVADVIRTDFELGALSTGRDTFYERLGWTRWKGRTGVRRDGALVRTPDDDGGIFLLPGSVPLDLDPKATISCEWRPGDVW